MEDSRLTSAIQCLVGVFHEYACKDEETKKLSKSMDQFKLSKKELKELLQKELNFENINDPAKMDELMKDLDEDGDGQVNFPEFVVFVASMACVCNDFLETILKEDCGE
ncbi:protein S100-A1 [Boleophthalmus pectinirostris]|uniref:protein S100-A1 n=1 Tax=Boleophthalmus pectinirostris TaxID=150288 RepID=UPI00242C14E8|nr:protein S100-A1 [Boleophthalmus pectinirostris]